jgi:hypothetical protein
MWEKPQEKVLVKIWSRYARRLQGSCDQRVIAVNELEGMVHGRDGVVAKSAIHMVAASVEHTVSVTALSWLCKSHWARHLLSSAIVQVAH